MSSYRPFLPPPQSPFVQQTNQDPRLPSELQPPLPQNWGYGIGYVAHNSPWYTQMSPYSGFEQGSYRNQIQPNSMFYQSPNYPLFNPQPPPPRHFPSILTQVLLLPLLHHHRHLLLLLIHVFSLPLLLHRRHFLFLLTHVLSFLLHHRHFLSSHSSTFIPRPPPPPPEVPSPPPPPPPLPEFPCQPSPTPRKETGAKAENLAIFKSREPKNTSHGKPRKPQMRKAYGTCKEKVENRLKKPTSFVCKMKESKIKEIEASFEACKSLPIHLTNERLQPVEVLPLLPDFNRYNNQFLVATFDSDPTADSDTYNKLDKSVRDACESKAVMKSCVAKDSESDDTDKFLSYLAPLPDEVSKDINDEDVSFSWVQDYHYKVQGDDVDDPKTYLVSFDSTNACYVPLPTKIKLSKKKASKGTSSKVVVRRRSIAAPLEFKETEDSSVSGRGRVDAKVNAAKDPSE